MGVTLAAFLLYLITLTPTITWQHGGTDSGDLAAAVATLGIAHPPGYPTYILLGYAWSWLPLGGDIAFRLNVLSALGGALAAGITTLTVAHLARHIEPPNANTGNSLLHLLGAIIGGLLLAVAPLMWSQAIITEVYAPGLAVLAGFNWFLFRAVRQKRHFIGAGLLLGLGFGILPQIALVGPGLLFLLLKKNIVTRLSDVPENLPQRHGVHRNFMIFSVSSVSQWFKFLCGVLLGLSVFIYLPLRAMANPVVNWGNPITLPRFWALVSAAHYHQYLGLLTWQTWLARLPVGLAQMVDGLSWAGVALAALGGLALWKRERSLLGYLLALAGLTFIFWATYPVSSNVVYLLPMFYMLALLGGLGMIRLLAAAQTQLNSRGAFLLGGAVIATLLLRAIIMVPQFESNTDRAARFGQYLLTKLPPTAVLISTEDSVTFSLWYQQALGNSTDVIVIDERLLAFDWYRDHIQTRHPDLDWRGDQLLANRPICRLSEATYQAIHQENFDALPASVQLICS